MPLFGSLWTRWKTEFILIKCDALTFMSSTIWNRLASNGVELVVEMIDSMLYQKPFPRVLCWRALLFLSNPRNLAIAYSVETVDARGQRLRKSLIEYPQRPTNNCLLILMFALDAHLHLKIQSNSLACPLPIINLRWMYKTRLGTSHQQRHIRMQPSHNSAQRVQTGWN